MFERPAHKDYLSANSFYILKCFRFCHPKFVYKLKRFFPEIGQPEIINFSNFGNFAFTTEHRLSSFNFDHPEYTLFY